MYQFACKDMGMNCDFVTSGNSVEEVTQKAMQHAQAAHADVLKTMTTPAQMEQMQQQLRKAIHSVAA